MWEKVRVLGSLLRPNAADMPIDVNFVTSTPEGPQKLATILSQEAKHPAYAK
jgi:hypothetical protein